MINVDVTPRKETPRWLQLLTPVATIFAALVVGAVPLVFSGFNPINAYEIVLLQPLSTPAGLTQTLVKAVPLTLASLAVYLPMRAGLWNIGAEGQIYVGGIVATWVALNINAPTGIMLVLVVLGGAFGGGIWGFIPGWLRAKWDVNEIIVTLMMTFIAVSINDYMVHGPMQGGRAGYPASEMIGEAAQLPSIPGTGVHLGIVLAVLAVVFVYVLLKQTRFGYEATVQESNPRAAFHAGISDYRVFVTVMVLGGALAGIGGMAEIAGSQHRLLANFSPGYGFTAIAIALLGRNSAFHVLLASLFFSVLFVGAGFISVQLNVSAALVEIIQALIILFLLTATFFQQFEVSLERSAVGGEAV
ncbi:ABC transporter permease [Halorubellus sp. JP-L1]|uniref:ABC transporter permease n=1 Tax=Halorubellus sp. JP-L1 TaxID=2715753 RepID=UPI001878FBD3|nr:ABC transporter permease [Halorubellus sp. JP-L1]